MSEQDHFQQILIPLERRAVGPTCQPWLRHQEDLDSNLTLFLARRQGLQQYISAFFFLICESGTEMAVTHGVIGGLNEEVCMCVAGEFGAQCALRKGGLLVSCCHLSPLPLYVTLRGVTVVPEYL